MLTKKKKPKFNVLNLGFFKSVKSRWRKPRGTHNKKRMKFKWAGALPKVGYKNAGEIRGMRAGMAEVLVNNQTELDGLKNVLVRIGSTVGAKKRKVLIDKAKSLGLKVVNAGSGPKKFMPKSGLKAHKGKPEPLANVSKQKKGEKA
jgi:large subunit ribosomal protein L32e